MSEYIMEYLPDTTCIEREEIVRCRDCKWRYVYMNDSYCDLDYAKIAIKPDGFCSSGEKKGSLENGIR